MKPIPITSRVSGAVGHSDVAGDGGVGDEKIPRWKDQWSEQPEPMAKKCLLLLLLFAFAWMRMVPVLTVNATRSCEQALFLPLW